MSSDSLTSTLAHAETQKELLWNADHDARGDKTSKLPAPEHITASSQPSLFALIIGIDHFKNLKPLTGCKNDANAVENYLVKELGVPPSHIKKLLDREATSAAIQTEIQKLARNPNIKQDDPILIFYAGHGGSTKTKPHWWPAWRTDPEIQMLCPHDFLPETTSSEAGQGVLDITLAKLLEDIANAKGNNITVVLDSCHSGSGTREDDSDVGVRGISLPEDYTIPNPPSILEDEDRGPGLGHQLRWKGLSSHVLLAGCRETQTSKENALTKRGRFTEALLELLHAIGPEKLTYKDAIERLPALPDNQDPQCEGVYNSRRIFNGKAPQKTRALYQVRLDKGDPTKFTLEAGEASGITEGAEFAIFKDKDAVGTLPPFGTLVVEKTAAFTAQLRFPPNAQSFPLPLSGVAFALQTRAGVRQDLRLFVDPNLKNILLRVKKDMDSNSAERRVILLVGEKEQPDLIVKQNATKSKATFEITDKACKEYGSTHLPEVDLDTDIIYSVILRAADFFRYLQMSRNESPIAGYIDFECRALVPASGMAAAQQIVEQLEPQGANLKNELGKIILEADDVQRYGFMVKNKSPRDLHASVLYFDCSDLSIAPLYRPQSARGGAIEPPIPRNGGQLTIGYGSSGWPALEANKSGVPGDEVGYLKVFLSTQYVDYSHMEQASPFDDDRGLVPSKPRNVDLWDTMLFTLAVREK